jgi:hypothetical protein
LIGLFTVVDPGRFFNFHAFRHTMGALLAAGGVHPKVAQTIMRHCTVDLTLNRYSNIYRGQESEAVNKLPYLSLPSIRQKAKVTGTEGGEKNLASYLALSGGKQRISTDSNGLLVTKSPDAHTNPKSVSEAPNRHFLGENAKGEPLRVVGFEPTTHGLKEQNRAAL